MATTKTLTPTNQTITIDAFQGEKPDHRHVADAETKLADAVNALNSQIGMEEFTLAAGTNVTINWQRCRRDYAGITNGLAVLEATFTTGAAISFNSTIMTGAPNIGGNIQFFTAVSDSGTIIPLGISGSTITTRAAIANGTKVRFIVSYFWTN